MKSEYWYLKFYENKESFGFYVKVKTLLQNRPLFQAICPGCLWARDKRWLLSRIQWLAGPAEGTEAFVPVGGTNRNKRTPFCPGWWLHPEQKAQPFCPGWWHQPGQKGPPRDSSKGSYSLLSHMY